MKLAMDRLDAAFAREIQHLRARYQLSLDEFRGLYVSDQQVDALLARGDPTPVPVPDLPPLNPGPALAKVIAAFGLDSIAADLLVLALAPDVDPKYATLIGYLNDDIGRRWPTIDLAVRLFGEGGAPALASEGPLFGPGLLLVVPTSEARQPALLEEFAPNPALSAHVLGRRAASGPAFVFEHAAPRVAGELDALEPLLANGAPLLAVLPDTGADRVAAIKNLGRPVVGLRLWDETAAAALRDGALAARLSDAVLRIEADAACLKTLAPVLSGLKVPVLLLAPSGEGWRPALAGHAWRRVDLRPPDHAERRVLWATALGRSGVAAPPEAIDEAAERFRLSARQIAAAAKSLRLASGQAPCDLTALAGAAREQAAADLATLAQRIVARTDWRDLVLPENCLGQLMTLASAINCRARVFGDWGLAGGPGLTALFGGGPGTGKTMSAGVLANAAGLDLWRIDLSAVVSKYIGETEKHLDRIFAQARDGNAILFFDEADAIFGKRSEVKDAHDRYANIEIAYLLQRLETFDGVVILATNLARNVDPAFSRRLHFVIDFPLPDAPLRERLWRAALPARAPLASDLDLALIARQFAFSGGDIRVAALDAAFAAAADGAPIDMTRLLQAIGRQLLKQGKVPQGCDVGAYRVPAPETTPKPIRSATG